jgi:hypothetical protein
MIAITPPKIFSEGGSPKIGHPRFPRQQPPSPESSPTMATKRGPCRYYLGQIPQAYFGGSYGRKRPRLATPSLWHIVLSYIAAALQSHRRCR